MQCANVLNIHKLPPHLLNYVNSHTRFSYNFANPVHKPPFATANMAIDALQQSAARFYGASLSEGQAPRLTERCAHKGRASLPQQPTARGRTCHGMSLQAISTVGSRPVATATGNQQHSAHGRKIYRKFYHKPQMQAASERTHLSRSRGACPSESIRPRKTRCALPQRISHHQNNKKPNA